MAVTATPIFTQTPKHVAVAVSTANTNADGTTGTYATIITAGANGAKVERLTLSTQGTNTADKVRLFINNKIWKEYLFAATTPSNTVTNLSIDVDCTLPGNTLVLSNAETLTANINTGAGNIVNVHAFYGDY